MPRLAPPGKPISFLFDGKRVEASAGETIATALVAAGYVGFARSPKFHRPRGPACFRAACDGCLARVAGEPNMMTCMIQATEGVEVHSQNTLGTRSVDLLRMTDWFFPSGLNHHELFAGVPGIEDVMQVFARRVAGLGKLPSLTVAPKPAVRRAVDCLVIGAGPSGMAAAVELALAGRSVEVIEERSSPLGSLALLHGPHRESFAALESEFLKLAGDPTDTGNVRLRLNTTAGGVFGDDVLVVSPTGGAEVLTAELVVFAVGAHDGVLAFEGNDLPGVMSVRAAGHLVAHGVAAGKKPVIAQVGRNGPFAESLAASLRSQGVVVQFVHAAPVRARGTSRVRRVSFEKESHDTDWLIVDAPRSPAYELPRQAGATLAGPESGFAVQSGRFGKGCVAVGELSGIAFTCAAIRAHVKAQLAVS